MGGGSRNPFLGLHRYYFKYYIYAYIKLIHTYIYYKFDLENLNHTVFPLKKIHISSGKTFRLKFTQKLGFRDPFPGNK